MKTLTCQDRKAFSISIEKILIIGIVLGVVGFLTAFGGDLIGTASVVETMDLSKQLLYADQEFVSVTIKNSGTTSISGIHAYVLIKDGKTSVPAPTTTGDYDCMIGGDKAVIATAVATTTNPTEGIFLSPGESVTISGDLYATAGPNTTPGTTNFGHITQSTNIDCSDIGVGANKSQSDITDRTEYILQVDGISEGGDIISATTTIRAR